MMGMSFGMSFEQRLTIDQRMEAAARVGGVLLGIERDLGVPTRTYEAMTRLTSESIRDEAIRGGVALLLANRGVRDTIIESPHYTSVQDAARLKSLMAFATHAYHRGDFTAVNGIEHGMLGTKVPAKLFLTACLEPAQIEQDMELIRTQARESGSVSQFQGAHLNEMAFCLKAATETKEDREKGALLLNFALRKVEGDAVSPLMRYSRELIFQREFLPFIADRVLERLASSAIQRSKMTNGFENSLRLSVAEFVLVAMGVVPPGLAHKGDGEILAQITADPKKSKAALGIDLKAEFERRLSHIKPSSLNQCAVELDKRSSELLPNFLRGPFAKDWDSLREALGGTLFVQAIREEAQKERKRTQALDSVIVSALEREEFLTLVKERIVRSWYPALDPYFAHRVPIS